MNILMLETRRGTEDGFTIQQYKEGHEYDMRDGLACAFIQRGYARSLEPRKTSEEVTDSVIADLRHSKKRRA